MSKFANSKSPAKANASPAALRHIYRRPGRPRPGCVGACLNADGISESVKSNVVVTIIELSGWLIVIIAVAVMLGRGRGDVSRVGQFPNGSGAGAGDPQRSDHRALVVRRL